ncbi:peptide ABC transporter permease [Halobacteriovorax marinus]|uniref:Peptide ABC transporter permease n=1 Tax=Halobacteriovorax marinus TaxID=97084 RepID=A0A1Y5FBB3_9BACT|nr:peptide ABC transporter permease [Halobacteriovorax marinus]
MIERFIENEITLKRWRRFKRNKPAAIALIIFLFSLFLTITSPYIANSDPLYLSYNGKSYFPAFKFYHPTEFGDESTLVMDYRTLKLQESDSVLWTMIKWSPSESNDNVDTYPSPPSTENLMGTDDRGRDVLTRILYGFKYSIAYALSVWVLTFIMGVIYGGVCGFFGGLVDLVGQRIAEVLSTMPQFFILIILIDIFHPSLFMLIVISCVFGWIAIMYYVRGEFLKNRKKEFVEAAQGMGAGNGRIIFKHILPNSLSPLITFSPFAISGGILGLASLDYLGFGLPVPTPSWGELLAQAQRNFTIAWWLAVFPGLALSITLFLLILVGDGVRDAMDPKLAEK